jgi:bifunctional UDP-N-acetylglucosamine pyrophosphorylase/glucosamine-1-phosphate N-acetyltransferase
MGPPGDRSLFCVVLAAGLGTRMKSSLPKVLHPLMGRPMLEYPLHALKALRPKRTVLVVGVNGRAVREAIRPPLPVEYATQGRQLGTAHAVRAGLEPLGALRAGTVLVTNGDTPLITAGTLRKFLSAHARAGNAVSVLSFTARDPSSYGRIVRGGGDVRIVEQKDATPKERNIREVNSGVYAIEVRALPFLEKIKLNRKKGEYYLTDLVSVALRAGARVGVFRRGEEEEFLGVNSRKDLLRAQGVLREKTVARHVEKGVAFMDPGAVYIDPLVSIGSDTLIYPNVYLMGDTRVGRGCTVYPNARITDSVIRDRAVVKDSTVIEKSVVGAGAQVGPFAHVRPESRIGEGARVGNFVELKKAVLGKGVKAGHLSYLGDAVLSPGVNVGAGTITCNYDGRKKHPTVIGAEVFIGSDTQLVAPVRVGKGAYIGAGSTITRDVPPFALAVSRTAQKTIPGWARKKR